ncbi:MAG: hypothetical protein V3W14_07000 [Candidatus Neomarinimicrobiota bacterium]
MVAYTPLTINDVDVREIYAYDSSGEEYILDGQVPPDFPVMVVGINERTEFNRFLKKGLLRDDEGGGGDGGGGGGETGGGGTFNPKIKITQVNLDRSALDYEPWWMGTNAELYFRVYETDINQGNVNAANFVPFIGYYAPKGGYKDYKIWNFVWYQYEQTKPWRTINLNTGWVTYGDERIFDYNKTYTLRLMEYDPLFYDGGINDWCEIAGLAAAMGAGVGQYITLIIGLASWLICLELVLNDDLIGEQNNFQAIVQETMGGQLGTEVEWQDSAFRIKFMIVE